MNCPANTYSNVSGSAACLNCPLGTVSPPGSVACSPTISVDAGNCQTVYRGYAPAACTTLNAAPSGGAPPYSYTWSNGSTAASQSVCPTANTTYTVTVTDTGGNTATDDVQVKVVDVRCGPGLNKVAVCHNGSNNLCVAASAVPANLGHGDALGTCGAPNPCGGGGLVGNSQNFAFDARKNEGKVELTWLTNLGKNDSYYLLQRSCDEGQSWQNLFVDFPAGLPSTPDFFEKTDARPCPGDNFYRVEIYRKNGSVDYSEIRGLAFQLAGEWAVFPNPATEKLTVRFSEKMASASGAKLVVTDLVGREFRRISLTNNDLQAPYSFDLAGMPSGAFVLSVVPNGERAEAVRFAVVKD